MHTAVIFFKSLLDIIRLFDSVTSSYTDPTGTVVGFLCRRFRTTLPAFYSGEYAHPHFLLIARETVVREFSFCCQFTSFYSFVNEIQKQFTLNISLQQANKLAIHPTLNRRLERGEPIAG
ncbi:hypothetical protein [Coleofasciculus sp. F4-SAH-05]|uniref:hypothetical protein n=1 Tax=Coleofasciculus sp. F4-SAH-05 TaxID=3069525 RepID=UPI0032F51B56